MIDYSDVEQVIEQCYNEMTASSRERYDSEKADRTAALFLAAQMKVSLVIEEAELQARLAKNEITRVEAEKYYDIKTNYKGDKKITENMMTSQLSKEPDIVQAKQDCAKQESVLKKWIYILGTLKDGHVYFRNLGKNKSWSE